jgi:hypothetical protein
MRRTPRTIQTREDGGELLGDLPAAVHLAAVEAHDDRLVGEAARVGVGVLPIPRVENRAVQPLYTLRAA